MVPAASLAAPLSSFSPATSPGRALQQSTQVRVMPQGQLQFCCCVNQTASAEHLLSALNTRDQTPAGGWG